MEGRVKFYNASKCFGFITTDEGDVYVGQAELDRAGIDFLPAGQAVSFDILTNEHSGRRRAVSIRLGTGSSPVVG